MPPPMTETVTIINKSGKVVSTGKQLINILKDAKNAYNDRKAELKEEHYARVEARAHRAQRRLSEARTEIRDPYPPEPSRRLSEARNEIRDPYPQEQLEYREAGDEKSVASSRRSHRSHRSHRSDRSRPPLTNNNISQYEDSQSVTSGRSHRSKRSRSQHGPRSRAPTQYEGKEGDEYYEDDFPNYRPPFAQTEITGITGITRRHTNLEDYDLPEPGMLVRRETAPPEYPSDFRPGFTEERYPENYGAVVPRANSLPETHDPNIDMNLAYGDIPPHLEREEPPQRDEAYKAELDATMTKLDTLLIEAQCLHHTATTIMTNLQANPEAMAAVALTLAELSNLLTKMSPSIIPILRASSPAIFGLLASPQFLIAGGVALGVTVVMFGGFKIIKRLSSGPEEKRMEAPIAMAMPASPMTPITPAYMEPPEMAKQEAMEFDGELSSIENWRRGIAEAELESVGTSIDGEYITPEVARQKDLSERIRQRAKEERFDDDKYNDEETRTTASRKSRSSHRSKTFPIRSRSPVEDSVAGDSVRSGKTSKSRKSRKSRSEKGEPEVIMEEKELPVVEEKKKKKTPLSLFRSKTEKLRSSSEKEKEKGKEKDGKKSGHHPLFLEL